MHTHADKAPAKSTAVQNERAASPVPSFADNRPESVAQRKLQETAAGSLRDSPVVQRQIDWVRGGRTHNRDLTNSLLYYHDFAITPVIINTVEIPGGDVSQALTGPAFLIDHKDNGKVHLSVAAEAINRVGYRMELPSPGPWQTLDTFARAKVAIATGGFSVSPDLRPPDNQIIEINAHGLPNDAAFATLVEDHEDYHVGDVRHLTEQIVFPWDLAITNFRLQGRTIVADSEQEAIDLFYEAVGGTPAQIANRFKTALRLAGLTYHNTQDGASPAIDSIAFDQRNPVPRLRVYWKHALDH